MYILFITSTAQSQARKIYLQPKTPARENQSKFIDSVRFLPLEVKDGIEPSAYYNIELTGKYFLLIDVVNKRLLLYSGDGHFVKTISYNKLGDNFYPYYDEQNNRVTFFGNNKNYTLTTKDRVKIKLDWNNPRNLKYFKKFVLDLNDPALTIKKDVPDEKDILKVRHYYDDYFIQGQISNSPLYKDSTDYEIKLYKNNQLVKAFFPYNLVNEPRYLYSEETVSFDKTDTPYIHYVARPFSDTIYKMIRDSLFPAYRLVLPLENTLPASFFTKPFKNKTDRENFYRNNSWMLHQVYNFCETPRLMYFMVRYLSNFESYIYDKQTDITYRTRNIRTDSTQYNLSLFSDFRMLRKGETFYKAIKAGDLLTFFDNNKTVAVPAELEEFLKSNPPVNAPVIVQFKFKK